MAWHALMPMRPAPHSTAATESEARRSVFESTLPQMGSVTIMARFTMEKYSVNVALGTPKNALTGVKKMPAHESTRAHGRQVMAMQAATIAKA